MKEVYKSDIKYYSTDTLRQVLKKATENEDFEIAEKCKIELERRKNETKKSTLDTLREKFGKGFIIQIIE